MDMKRRVTPFPTITSRDHHQSMGTREICILVTHDRDELYPNIISEMLQHCCHYEVLKLEAISDALNAIGEKQDMLDLIITDIHGSNSKGFEILQSMEKEFDLPIMSMTPHKSANITSSQGSTTSANKLYFLKSLSVEDFKTLWQCAYAKERGKATNYENIAVGGEAISLENNYSSYDQKRKRRVSKERNEQNKVITTAKDDHHDDSSNEKKQRVVWNEWMHHKFLEAIQELGHDRAFPKKIAELMGVPGLTREKVASHLQKYRMGMTRAAKDQGTYSASSSASIHQTCFLSIHSSALLNFNSLRGNSPNPNFSSNNNTFMSSSSSSSTTSFHPEATTASYNPNLEKGQFDQIVQTTPNLLDFGTPSCYGSSTYMGYRLTDNGKKVEIGTALSNIESLVQCPSSSSSPVELEYCIPPQQEFSSLQSSMPHNNGGLESSLGVEDEDDGDKLMDGLLGAPAGSTTTLQTSSWNVDFCDTPFLPF